MGVPAPESLGDGVFFFVKTFLVTFSACSVINASHWLGCERGPRSLKFIRPGTGFLPGASAVGPPLAFAPSQCSSSPHKPAPRPPHPGAGGGEGLEEK